MSYDKKLWTNRDSQYPNRRILTDINEFTSVTVDVERDEGATYSEGVEFNATTMNNLETRIENAFQQTQEKLSTRLNLLYPIGSIYISMDSTSPATIFGGTWQSISGGVLLPSNNCNLTPQGSDNATLSFQGAASFSGQVQPALAELPYHNHQIPGNTTYTGAGNQYSGGTTYKSGPSTVNTGGAKDSPDGQIPAKQETHSHGFSNGKINVNGGIAINNMMPCITVYAWRRTA